MKYGIRRKKRVENITSKSFFMHITLVFIILIIAAFGAVEIASRLNFDVATEVGAGRYEILMVKDVTLPEADKYNDWLAVYAISNADNLDATARKIARKQFKRFLWKDKVYDKIYVFVWTSDGVDTYFIANQAYTWNKG